MRQVPVASGVRILPGSQSQSKGGNLGAALTLESVTPRLTTRQVVFAIGEPGIVHNLRGFLFYGSFFGLIPLSITLYEYANQPPDYPFIVLSTLGFLVNTFSQWLFYASFFGLFFIYLRGNTGLGKGWRLSLLITLPVLITHLLNTQGTEQLLAFGVWATQIFLFCSFLGLWAVDYRLLRQHHFNLRDLLTVHNFSSLSVYASSVLVALTPTLISLFTGRMGEFLDFVINNILPQTQGIPGLGR